MSVSPLPARSLQAPVLDTAVFDLIELSGPSGPLLPHRIGGTPVRDFESRLERVDPLQALPADSPGSVLIARFGEELHPESARASFHVEEIVDGLAHPVPGQVRVDGTRLVFAADRDDDPSTEEPLARTGSVLRVRIDESLRSRRGARLTHPAQVTVPVGLVRQGPSVRSGAQGELLPLHPLSGALGVDPATEIVLAFDESMQPESIQSILVEFGPFDRSTAMPYSARPCSPYDLTTWILSPTAAFPGGGETGAREGFDQVTLGVPAGGARSLDGRAVARDAWTTFNVGSGPGLINAPVAPESILVAGEATLSVIDLNGFGQSTGDPTFDQTQVIEGNTNFPNNPNVLFQGGSLVRPLAPGTSTVDGGSAGVFTLTKDSNLSSTLLGAPLVASLGDLVLGAPLDRLFNNAPAPFGCQSGGGSLCSIDGLQAFGFENAPGMPLQPGTTGTVVGLGNPISWAPHPNPPPIQFPPLCMSPLMQGQEPTTQSPGVANLLVPGDAFGSPSQNIPPSGLFGHAQRAYFTAPSTPQGSISACEPYIIRQQIGQLLYALDPERRQLVVLNSNTMRVLDRIDLMERPTELASSPNLDYVAVACSGADAVQFIDTRPESATFHQVVQTTNVGSRPRGIAWDGGREDILVCNEGDGTLSILSAFTLQVRKTVDTGVQRPFAVAISPRQLGFDYDRQVYFAWIVGRDGRVAVFESGPDGVNGWGYDNVIGQLTETFPRPQAIQLSPDIDGAGAWIAHTTPAGGGQGALSRIGILAATQGLIPLTNNTPQFRNMTVGVSDSIDETVLSGRPVDICFDNLVNFGALPNRGNPFAGGVPEPINGKDPVRDVFGEFHASRASIVMFAAVPGQDVVDVIELQPGFPRLDVNAFQPGVQSVPALGARLLADYFRQ